MPDTMTTTVSVLGGYGQPRRHVVTLPRIEALLAEPASRYSVPAVEPGAPARPPRQRDRFNSIELSSKRGLSEKKPGYCSQGGPGFRCAQPGLRASLARKYVLTSPIPLIASAPRSSNVNASRDSV
jgi:hypothetical protein